MTIPRPLGQQWQASYDDLMTRMRPEMDMFVLTLRQRIGDLGESAAVQELAADFGTRPFSEVAGLAIHAMVLLARGEAVQ